MVRRRDGGYVAQCGGGSYDIEVVELAGESLRLRHAGTSEAVRFLRDGDALYLHTRGRTIAACNVTLAAPDRAAAQGGDGRLRAAMTGRVVAVHARPGDSLAAGQPVITLEAMKMEHVHVAPVGGIVKTILVADGDQITTGRIVAEIEPNPDLAPAARERGTS
jgi:geranyl-CoA carboxylase alpha subunit